MCKHKPPFKPNIAEKAQLPTTGEESKERTGPFARIMEALSVIPPYVKRVTPKILRLAEKGIITGAKASAKATKETAKFVFRRETLVALPIFIQILALLGLGFQSTNLTELLKAAYTSPELARLVRLHVHSPISLLAFGLGLVNLITPDAIPTLIANTVSLIIKDEEKDLSRYIATIIANSAFFSSLMHYEVSGLKNLLPPLSPPLEYTLPFIIGGSYVLNTFIKNPIKAFLKIESIKGRPCPNPFRDHRCITLRATEGFSTLIGALLNLFI